MAKIVTYHTDRYGNRRYDKFLTAKDRKELRRARDSGRPLSNEQKQRIFDDPNPTFKKRY